MLQNHTLRSGLVVLVLLGVGIPLWYRFAAARPAPPTAPPRDLGPVPVAVRKIEPARVEVAIEAYGTLLAAREVSIALEVAGRIAEVHPDWRPGGSAEAGEVLVALDPEPFRLAVEAARAAQREADAGLRVSRSERQRAQDALAKAGEGTALALREVERRQALLDEGASSPAALDLARRGLVAAELADHDAAGTLAAARARESMAIAAFEGATTAVQQAEDRQARGVLVAPFGGRFAGRGPVPGALAGEGVSLGALLDLSSLHLSLRVVEDDLVGLRPGMSAEVTLPARTGESFFGRVRAVALQADPQTRAAAVEVEVRPAEGGPPLAAGQFAHARVTVADLPDALLVDRSEFVWRAGEATVFTVVGDVVEARALKLGRTVGEGFVVASGLVAGDRIAVHPLDRLYDGVRVAPRDGGAPPP